MQALICTSRMCYVVCPQVAVHSPQPVHRPAGPPSGVAPSERVEGDWRRTVLPGSWLLTDWPPKAEVEREGERERERESEVNLQHQMLIDVYSKNMQIYVVIMPIFIIHVKETGLLLHASDHAT